MKLKESCKITIITNKQTNITMNNYETIRCWTRNSSIYSEVLYHDQFSLWFFLLVLKWTSLTVFITASWSWPNGIWHEVKTRAWMSSITWSVPFFALFVLPDDGHWSTDIISFQWLWPRTICGIQYYNEIWIYMMCTITFTNLRRLTLY